MLIESRKIKAPEQLAELETIGSTESNICLELLKQKFDVVVKDYFRKIVNRGWNSEMQRQLSTFESDLVSILYESCFTNTRALLT